MGRNEWHSYYIWNALDTSIYWLGWSVMMSEGVNMLRECIHVKGGKYTVIDTSI